jgi:hypothetical protein
MDADAWTVIGTVVSVGGVGLSIWVLIVAKGAKRAADAANAAARKRNLVEELESAAQKIQQIGVLIQQEEWVAAQMRIDEVFASCRTTLARWPDHLSE